MSAVLLTVAIALTQFILGAMGVYVSLRPPEQKYHKYWIGGFVIVGFAGIFVTAWLANSSDAAQEGLKGKLDQSLLAQQYTKGQLDSIGLMISRITVDRPDPQLGQLAAAIRDMAKANQKQAEDVKATNLEIAARATDLAKRIRAFESKYEADREAGIEQEWQATVSLPDEQRRAVSQQTAMQQIKNYQDHELAFRNMFAGDAVYLKDLILQRLSPEEASRLRSANSQAESNLAFGMMAGAFNEYKIADYLEELAKSLEGVKG